MLIEIKQVVDANEEHTNDSADGEKGQFVLIKRSDDSNDHHHTKYT